MSAAVVEVLPSFEPGTDDWIAQRARRVGGSEIAAVLGLSKWHSRFSLWHQKAGRFNPVGDTPETEWGKRLEDVLARKYADEHPDVCVGPARTVTRTDRPYQLASPDRELGECDALLELKTQRDQEGWGEPGTDEIPVYYRCQVLWYLDTLELPWCDLAVLIGGSDYREYRVTYDPADALRLREAAVEFIESIDANQRPPIDEHDATYRALREMHPDIEMVDVEIPYELARDYCTARTEAKQASDELAVQTSRLADAVGSGRRAVYLGTTIATRQARGDGTPYLVAGRNLPDFLKAA